MTPSLPQYAGAVSRYLDLVGKTVDATPKKRGDPKPDKLALEFAAFETILRDMATEKRNATAPQEPLETLTFN